MAQQPEATDAADTVQLLWGVRTTGSRGPKPTLSVERIAEAAVAVADAEGIEAVSMQRVAESLGFTKMSLYRYVASKADLLAVMIEHAVGEPPDLARSRGGWRGRLEKWARLLGESWEAHPWLPEVTTGARVMGPREVAWVEAGVAALAGTPFSPAERMDVVVVISGHLRNTQSGEVAGTQPWHDPRHTDLLRADADRFPALVELTGRRGRTPRQTRDFGLRCLLDGFELQVARRGD